MKKYFIYKMFDGEDNLIYVGKTHHIDRRMKQHFGNGSGHLDRKHYNSVVKVLYHECSNKIDMDMKETYFITNDKPLCNTIHSKNEPPSFDVGEIEWKEYEELHDIKEKERIRLEKKFPYLNREPSFSISERGIIENIKKYGYSEFLVYVYLSSRKNCENLVTTTFDIIFNRLKMDKKEGKRAIKEALRAYENESMLQFYAIEDECCDSNSINKNSDYSKYGIHDIFDVEVSTDEREVEISYESFNNLYHKLGQSRNKIYALYCVFCALSKSSNRQFKTSMRELQEITGFAKTTLYKYLEILEEDFGAIETKKEANGSVIKCKLTKKYYDIY